MRAVVAPSEIQFKSPRSCLHKLRTLTLHNFPSQHFLQCSNLVAETLLFRRTESSNSASVLVCQLCFDCLQDLKTPQPFWSNAATKSSTFRIRFLFFVSMLRETCHLLSAASFVSFSSESSFSSVFARCRSNTSLASRTTVFARRASATSALPFHGSVRISRRASRPLLFVLLASLNCFFNLRPRESKCPSFPWPSPPILCGPDVTRQRANTWTERAAHIDH